MSKLIGSVKEAIEKTGLKDGMTISFHHHMRNGDYVLNMVLEEAAAMGIKDLTVNASSVFDVHEPIIEHIKNGVVTGIECNYMGGRVGKAISQGIMEKPVIFRTHGGRAGDMENGSSKIDIAFLAAPTADNMGNCSGKYGPSACGSLGYAFSDAVHAKKVVVITDNLVSYPLKDTSINEGYVDYVVEVPQIGDPAKIVSGTTKITRDPVGLRIASLASQVVKHSGYLKDGIIISTATGSTGYSLSAGGPIVSPETNIMIMTPVAPHTLNTRSIIFPAGDEIAVEITHGVQMGQGKAIASFDGDTNISMTLGDKVVIRRTVQDTKIVKISNISFLEVLRKKMKN